MENAKKIRELVEELKLASKVYYSDQDDIMTNYEYDAKYDELKALEEKTGIVFADSPTQVVEYEVVSELKKDRHETPMLSLDKTKSVEALKEKANGHKCFLSWKLDGLTVVLTYENGGLSKAVTRGNGEIGEIITHNAVFFKGVPQHIPDQNKLVIRGEAVISYGDFEIINENLPDGVEQYKNPRNLCSGTVRNLDANVAAERNVEFVAFEVVSGVNINSHSGRLEYIKDMGFHSVEGYLCDTPDEIENAIERFDSDIKNGYRLPSDGVVMVYDDIEYGKSLGMTSKFPRNGIAFKWTDDVAATELLDVEWSVSRTGLINPVAIFKPVELEGTTVQRATLHNLSIISELKLGIGDEIEVIKANKIIPQIVGNRTKSDTLTHPKFCPVCGAPTEIHVNEKSGCRTLHCTGDNCITKRATAIEHFCSRDAMNIVGLSGQTIFSFLSIGVIHDMVDVYKLEKHKDKIVELEGFGEKSYQKLIDAIEASKDTEIYRVLYALGVPNFGSSNCKNVCRSLGIKNMDDAAMITKEELLSVDGIGEVMANAFVQYFDDIDNVYRASKLMEYLRLKEPEETGEQILKGMTVVITGKLDTCGRKELQERIEKAGGKASGSVSAKTSILVNNDNTSESKKNVTAKELGIPIMTEKEFLDKYPV